MSGAQDCQLRHYIKHLMLEMLESLNWAQNGTAIDLNLLKSPATYLYKPVRPIDQVFICLPYRPELLGPFL